MRNRGVRDEYQERTLGGERTPQVRLTKRLCTNCTICIVSLRTRLLALRLSTAQDEEFSPPIDQ